MKKKIILFLLLLLFIPFNKVKAISVSYQSHIQSIGWQDAVSNGEIGGTTGRSLRMEAIKLKLTGELAEHYDIYYRVHSQKKGWLPWVSNGEEAGTTGLGLRMEAIQIKIFSKNEVYLSYSSHSKNGWQDYVESGEMSGSTGNSVSIDQIKINIENGDSNSVTYQVYNNINGWQNETGNNSYTGTLNIPIEAIKIKLEDNLSKDYNIFYRVHVSHIGWMGWTSNGSPAGTTGYFNNIEAIEIKILRVNDNSLSNSTNSFMQGENKITYSSHIQSIGWQDYVEDGKTSGTTGRSLRMEAYKIKLDSVLDGDIVYKTYISKRGWSGESKSNEMSGTSGLSRNIEAIQIKLTGNISNYFDIYYRVHASHIGWMGWAKNGSKAGCIDSDSNLEAIEIKLVNKNTNPNLNTNNAYLTGTWKNNKYYDYFGNMAKGFKIIDGVKYYFNPEGKQYGKNVQKIIDVSSWQGTINWDFIKTNDDVDAAIIRVGWGTSYNDPCGLDSYFDRNIKEVQRLGIPYGIYIYAYAETTQAAQKEADFVVSKMKQYNMPKNTYVWYDAEISSIPRNTYNTVIPAFINRIKSNGYNNVGVYSGVRQLDTTNGNTNTSTIRSYPIWVSQYYKDLQYTGTYKGWQFASDEKVYGINGNVDVSMFFK